MGRVSRGSACLILACLFVSRSINPSVATPHNATLQPSLEQPRLIVLLVIDQFPASSLRRFSPFFSGGLKQLFS